jgi:hypothetical protein
MDPGFFSWGFEDVFFVMRSYNIWMVLDPFLVQVKWMGVCLIFIFLLFEVFTLINSESPFSLFTRAIYF